MSGPAAVDHAANSAGPLYSTNEPETLLTKARVEADARNVVERMEFS
jgi:hypothetical protein